MKRRDFINKSAIGMSSLAAAGLYDLVIPMEAGALGTGGGMGIEEGLYLLEKGKAKNIMPEVRPEIRDKPRAVFLIETHVDAKKDKKGYDGYYKEAVPQLHKEGKRIASELFVKGTTKGGSTFIKPNFTWVPEHRNHRTNGVYSSPDFIVGMVEQLREIGNSNVICGEGPTNAQNHRHGGAYDGFDSGNVNMIEMGYEKFSHYTKKELNWKKVPDSLIWKQIPYCRPVGDPDNFLINVATLKVHETSITTLTTKNLQGCVPKGYGQFCIPWIDMEALAYRSGIDFKRHFHKDYYQRIEKQFLKHRAKGFKRWEDNVKQSGSYKRYEELGGWNTFRKLKMNSQEFNDFVKETGPLMRQEMWIQRGLDNASVLKPQMNIIEGIIGLDGTALNNYNIGEDHLCNIVIAGLSTFEVDVVGNYIMGHDPREIWYTRIAKERNLSECDINKIDIYRIRNGEIIPVRNLAEIKRHPLGLNWALHDDPAQRLFW